MVAVTTSRTAVVTLPTDSQIKIVREFNAPRHLVFKAWTTPELIKRWWNAKRGVVTLAEVDLRVGGKWRWVMMADGGFEVAFHGEYREIIPNEHIVYTEAFEGVPNADESATLNTLTLVEKAGRTTATMLSEAHTRELRDLILGTGMEDGMQDALDLLEEVAVSLL
jgi:uncharacterized protein YndB with AHSA1/START domain